VNVGDDGQIQLSSAKARRPTLSSVRTWDCEPTSALTCTRRLSVHLQPARQDAESTEDVEGVQMRKVNRSGISGTESTSCSRHINVNDRHAAMLWAWVHLQPMSNSSSSSQNYHLFFTLQTAHCSTLQRSSYSRSGEKRCADHEERGRQRICMFQY
jgi:hypothetical protein